MENKKNFDSEMLNVYRRAYDEAHYKATYLLQMLNNHGAFESARLLIHSPKVSEGYIALWERGRLDLTVEALIHDNLDWHSLFTEEELEIVRKRLIEYGYKPASRSSIIRNAQNPCRLFCGHPGVQEDLHAPGRKTRVGRNDYQGG
jgi:hypothetical protein